MNKNVIEEVIAGKLTRELINRTKQQFIEWEFLKPICES